MSVPVRLEVSAADLKVLQARVNASTTARRDWQRAMVVLLSCDGAKSAVIGETVGLSLRQVDTWRHRYKADGLDGLRDLPRSGCPQTFSPHDRLTLVKTITTRPVETGQSTGKRVKARMSIPEVTAILNDVHGIKISYSQTWRICKALSLKPWQARVITIQGIRPCSAATPRAGDRAFAPRSASPTWCAHSVMRPIARFVLNDMRRSQRG